eukprot:2199097-Ditylum_brightwellii.AAC.1
MTVTAKQHWLESVKIATKAFLAAHKLPPAQQTITQFFSNSQALSRGTVEQISSPHVLDASEHADLAQINTQAWSTSTIDSTDIKKNGRKGFLPLLPLLIRSRLNLFRFSFLFRDQSRCEKFLLSKM